MSSRLRLWEVEVPFRRALQTAAGPILSRRSVIVAVDRDDATGWAEAPAFPSGRFGTADEAFDALADRSSWSGGWPKVPVARAALEAARADAAARSRGIPLHSDLGASGDPVPARHPIGLIDAGGVEHEAAWLQSHGILAVKVKVAPGHDLEPLAELRRALPALDIGVDANGAYDSPDDPVFEGFDELEVTFVEQPFPPPDLESHSALRARSRFAVCLDESVPTSAGIRRAIAAAAADQIAVKLNRVGLTALRQAIDIATSSGVAIQLGGTFDTSLGRRHLLAAATLPGVVDAAVGPPAAYLSRDIGTYPQLIRGMVAPDATEGIGPEPSSSDLDVIASRRVI